MEAAPELLPDRLARHARLGAGATAFRFIDRPGAAARELTWGELWGAASATANTIGGRGLVDERIGIACEDAADFVIGLVACMISGNTVVPFPVALSRRAAPRARSIADAARPRAVLLSGDGEIPDWLADLEGQEGTIIVRVGQSSGETVDQWSRPAIAGSDLALVQFSSGSTGTPIGVGLSHGNLAANCAAIVEAYGVDAASRAFCWLPLHHDMGLVGHVLASMWIGCRSSLMNPLRFLQRPLDWLRLIAQERASITSAPNFAYEICARAAAGQDLSDIDLSCLTAAICGGEPVLRPTVNRFLAAFAGAGLSPSAFAPSYGLAEATLLVASGRDPAGPRFVEVAAMPSGRTSESGGDGTALVADLGPPVRGVSVRIVDGRGGEVAEGTVGEIEVSGASVGRLIDGDGRLMPAAALGTGDLGFVRGGHLHVVGRKKDIIIVRGQNVHPADIEAAALEAHPAIVPGGLAAVGVEVDGTEDLVVLVEVNHKELSGPREIAGLRRRVRESVALRVGHVAAAVVTLRPGALPRTSSGKVRRFEATALLRSGALEEKTLQAPSENEMPQPV